MPREAVISVPDADTIYRVPLVLEDAGLGKVLAHHFDLPGDTLQADLQPLAKIVHRSTNPRGTIPVAVVGKYVQLPDAYLSVTEALRHAGIHHDVGIEIRWIQSETLDQGDTSQLKGVAGIVVPGGFGHRGIEGKVVASRFARHHLIPYLGLCLGMQCAVIDLAREVLACDDANSTEFNAFTPHPVIDLLPEQRDVNDKGGTMRLGSYPCVLDPGSLASRAYAQPIVLERHRHRYEFNNAYRELLAQHGMRFSGLSPDGRLVEIVEIDEHPFFLGTQFHPEFKSRPNRPHPLFSAFIDASLAYARANGRAQVAAPLLQESKA